MSTLVQSLSPPPRASECQTWNDVRGLAYYLHKCYFPCLFPWDSPHNWNYLKPQVEIFNCVQCLKRNVFLFSKQRLLHHRGITVFRSFFRFSASLVWLSSFHTFEHDLPPLSPMGHSALRLRTDIQLCATVSNWTMRASHLYPCLVPLNTTTICVQNS